MATILFSDLSDSTRIAGHLETEDYAKLLAHLRGIYRRTIAAHGGQIAQISGDGMMAAFGYPEPGEDDIARAVMAALDLRDAVRRLAREERWLEVTPRVHTGVHAGRVLLLTGDDVRGRFELLGRPTNIASRLCGEAGPDQILVSAQTLGPQHRLFDTSVPFKLRLRGKDRPVAAVNVHGRSAARNEHSTPFLGRTAELGILAARFGEALDGGRALVEIRGPPGEGKTRLAEEFVRRAIEAGRRAHAGKCERTGSPLHPFMQIARSIFGIGTGLPPGQAAERVRQALEQLDPALMAHRLAWTRLLSLTLLPRRPVDGAEAAAAFDALARTLTRREPLLLFIDDWHLADDASRVMLNALAGIPGLCLLLTSRPRDGAQGDIERETIALAPFSHQERARMVRALLATADPFSIASIGRLSGGKPLFIEELCHAYASGETDVAEVEGAPFLAGLVQSRLARLADDRAAVVRAAAIIGEVVPVWLLESVCGRDIDDGLVGDLAEADFLFRAGDEGNLRFKHGLTREIVYDGIGLQERKAIHLRAAGALRRQADASLLDGHVEALAYHFGRGDAWVEAAHYAERAGDRALEAGAIDRAQAQYRQAFHALDQIGQGPEQAARWISIAERFGRAGVFDPAREQLDILVRAVRQQPVVRDPAALARAHFWLGYIHYGLGDPLEAVPHCEQALAAAREADDQPLAVQTIAALGQAKAAACDYRAALPLLDEAIAVKRRHLSGRRVPIGLAYSLSCKGFALGDMGRSEEAHACFLEAQSALAGSGHPGEVSVLNQHAVTLLWENCPEEALERASEGMRVAERVGSNYSHAMSRSIAAFARWRIAGEPAAVETILEATAWLEARQRGQFTSLNHSWLAEIMVAQGRMGAVLRHAKRALRRAQAGDRLGEAAALRALARRAAGPGGARPPRFFLDLAAAAAQSRASPHEEAANLSCRRELGLPESPSR